MKLRFLDRILLWIGAFFAVAVGVGLVMLAFQTGGIELARKGESTVRLAAWLLVLIGVALFTFALYGMSLPAKYKRGGGDFVVQKTTSGELRISVKAMESLVQKVFADHKEAALKHMRLLNHRDGLLVDLTVSLAGNVSIPLVVDALQKQITQHIRTASGVEVKQVRVSVETADNQAVDSPYELRDLPSVEQAAETDQESNKQGLHLQHEADSDETRAGTEEGTEHDQG